MRRLMLVDLLFFFKSYFLFLFLLAFSLPSASEWYTEKRLSIDFSSRFEGKDHLTTQVNKIALKTQYYTSIVDFNFDGEWRYDSVYHVHSRYSDESEEEYQNRFWLNEAFIELRLNNYDIALGYQKIVWGQADDLRITDIVNPLDLKDFVLFDVDDYRISLPMLRVESHVNNWQLQGLWVLDTEPHQLPPRGSEFSLATPVLGEGATDDSEFGFKVAGYLKGADVAFYTFYGYADSPVIDVRQDTHLFYDKETMVGMSLAQPVNVWVLRSEWAWFDGRAFNRSDNEIVEHNVLQWLLGADYLYKDWLLTFQVTDRIIQDWQKNLTVEERSPLYTLSADTTILSGSFTLRFAISHSEDTGQGQLYQIKTRYRPCNRWELSANLDALTGDENNFFGQFNANDRIWFAAAYTF